MKDIEKSSAKFFTSAARIVLSIVLIGMFSGGLLKKAAAQTSKKCEINLGKQTPDRILQRMHGFLPRLPSGWEDRGTKPEFGNDKACPSPGLVYEAVKDDCLVTVILLLKSRQSRTLEAQMDADMKRESIKRGWIRQEKKEGVDVEVSIIGGHGKMKSFEMHRGQLVGTVMIEHVGKRPSSCDIIEKIYKSFDYKGFAAFGAELPD
jgi:hypothetical protein